MTAVALFCLCILLDCGNLFEILRSIDIVERLCMVAFCLGPRMHERQNRVHAGECIEEC